ncbi:hypothetical protein S7711_10578 [Stachybotrys chartarum IBT 7711]|uniref:Uncharacterized protein n=1 Tax=Stachybotrys chartarum (strain CBS 109288 / IBT 7711) TaxID=1280523 RepID=A0A084B554_STACB|nr:hypothetical protein S7711_10578 [Stachybotrys chartarum IBT 7711]KFA48212.1 hypothetical protein S40293_11179 [Stachybotrys chartarum IBT 40293]KFA79833.1 hypothetical protein S40288_10501 [Stachybotrys chartarum IBT 40288]
MFMAMSRMRNLNLHTTSGLHASESTEKRGVCAASAPSDLTLWPGNFEDERIETEPSRARRRSRFSKGRREPRAFMDVFRVIWINHGMKGGDMRTRKKRDKVVHLMGSTMPFSACPLSRMPVGLNSEVIRRDVPLPWVASPVGMHVRKSPKGTALPHARLLLFHANGLFGMQASVENHFTPERTAGPVAHPPHGCERA